MQLGGVFNMVALGIVMVASVLCAHLGLAQGLCVGATCCVSATDCPESILPVPPPGVVFVRDGGVFSPGHIQTVIAIAGVDGVGENFSPFLARRVYDSSTDPRSEVYYPVEFTPMPRSDVDYLEWFQQPFDGHGVVVHRVTTARGLARLLHAAKQSRTQHSQSTHAGGRLKKTFALNLRIVYVEDNFANTVCSILADDFVGASTATGLALNLLSELRNFDLVLRDTKVHFETLRVSAPHTHAATWERVLRGIRVIVSGGHQYQPLRPLTVKNVLSRANSQNPQSSERVEKHCLHRNAIELAAKQFNHGFRSVELVLDSPNAVTKTRCVESVNARTASIFVSNFLHAYGGREVFNFRMASSHNPHPCNELAHAGNPKLRLLAAHQLNLANQYQVKLNAFDTRNYVDNETSMTPPAFLTGDEHCNAPATGPWLTAFLGRQYDAKKYAAGKMGEMYLPLGVRHELSPFYGVVPQRRRKFLVNFAGSLGTHATRRLMRAAALKWETQNNVSPHNSTSYWHFADEWVADPSKSTQHLDPSDYQRIILDSYFTLCPRGHAFETFRFWEAIDVLSIPILVRPDHNVSAVVDRARVDAFSHFTKLDGKFVAWSDLLDSCDEAFDRVLSKNPPVVLLDSWDELPSFLARMVSDPDFEMKIRQQQFALKVWAEGWWRGVARKLDESLRPYSSATVPP